MPAGRSLLRAGTVRVVLPTTKGGGVQCKITHVAAPPRRFGASRARRVWCKPRRRRPSRAGVRVSAPPGRRPAAAAHPTRHSRGTAPMGKTIAQNRKARHDYIIEDTLEAGLVLTGTEIKSIREGKVNLQDAYARVDRGEAWLVGAHVAPWSGGNRLQPRAATRPQAAPPPHPDRPAGGPHQDQGPDARAARHLPQRPRPGQGGAGPGARQEVLRPPPGHRRARRPAGHGPRPLADVRARVR